MARVLSSVLLLILGLFVSVEGRADIKNELANNPSPYLAMHGHDPVAWQLWNEQTVSLARQQDKLLFISIGYFSCHWCHVMQRESYSNKEIAAVINKNYIPVKIDRELNPALDAALIDFVQSTRGQAGWPLNVFVTPEGHPLIGITYLPAKNFLDLITSINDSWQSERANLKAMAADAAAEMQKTVMSSSMDIPENAGAAYESRLIKFSLQLADEMAGGFGNQNKFPQVPQLLALLAAYQRQSPQSRDELKQFLILTLDQMMTQGLHDNLGGGFFRYAVDPTWKIPHFEKMLYNNTMMIELYLKAADIFDNPQYQKQARHTLDFLLRDFRHSDGAFIASLSSIDDRNIEGGYYLWSNEELQKLLSKQERQVVQLHWGMQGDAELEAGHHAVQTLTLAETAKQMVMDKPKVDKLLRTATRKLLKARSSRTVPRDDKVLASWNGLALRAFARAARLKEGAKYHEMATWLNNYLTQQFWDGNTLLRARSQGRSLGNGTLEDYAYVSSGMFEYARLSGDKNAYALAKKIVEQAWARFFDHDGWRLSEKMLISYGGAEEMLSDGSLYSPSGVVIQTSLGLAAHFKDKQLREKALGALNNGHDALESDSFWYATHITAMADSQSDNK